VKRHAVAEVLEQAYKRSATIGLHQQAGYVRSTLGGRLAAAALGLEDLRTLQSWEAGGQLRSPEAQHRLQVLYRLTYSLAEGRSRAVAAAFLHGSNPHLEDRTPLLVLARSKPGEVEAALLEAAEAVLTA